MLLSTNDFTLFLRLHLSFFYFCNQQLNIVPDVSNAEELKELPNGLLYEIQTAISGEIDLIKLYVDENPDNFNSSELKIVSSWKDQVRGKFYLFRQLKKQMIFLSHEDPPAAYGVVALSEPIESVVGSKLPQMVETVLLPFKGKIIYSGLISSYNISFGGGFKRGLNEDYKNAKQRSGVILSLPFDQDAPIPAKKTPVKKKKKPKKKTNAASNETKLVLETILKMTDSFCKQHLNEEYVEYCRLLAIKLSRKRPSPLLRGKPATWACGIIRTIGWVNYLDDRTSEPYMRLPAIDEAMGVAQSTGQGKSKEIRTMLKIRNFDMDWTLPSGKDDNLIGWMLEINGIIMDVRNAPREVQELAFEKGMIPYIPADRK